MDRESGKVNSFLKREQLICVTLVHCLIRFYRQQLAIHIVHTLPMICRTQSTRNGVLRMSIRLFAEYLCSSNSKSPKWSLWFSHWNLFSFLAELHSLWRHSHWRSCSLWFFVKVQVVKVDVHWSTFSQQHFFISCDSFFRCEHNETLASVFLGCFISVVFPLIFSFVPGEQLFADPPLTLATTPVHLTENTRCCGNAHSSPKRTDSNSSKEITWSRFLVVSNSHRPLWTSS